MIRHLKIGQKLTLMGIVFMIPFAVVTYKLINSVNTLGVQFAVQESRGLEYCAPLLKLLPALQERRELTCLATPQNPLTAQLADNAAEIRQDIQAVDAVDARLSNILHATVEWQMLKAECQEWIQQTGYPSPDEAFDRSTRIISDALAFIADVGDTSNLTLDPDIDTYYLMDVMVFKGPKLTEWLAQSWTLTREGATGINISERAQQLHRLSTLTGDIQDEINVALKKVYNYNPALPAKLALPQAAAAASLQQVLDAQAQALPGAEAGGEVQKQLSTLFQMESTLSASIQNLLQLRIDRFQSGVTHTLIWAGLGLLLVSLIGFAIVRDITSPLGSLVGTARELATGNLDTSVAIGRRRDEVGELGRAFGSMMEAVREARQKLLDTNKELMGLNDKLSEATQAKSRLLATMSHEIRTPMNAIIGMTELTLNTRLTPVQREYLETVRNSAEALLALLNDILDFSKIEAGKVTLEQVGFDLRDSLGDVMQTLAVRAHAKNLELSLHVHPNVPDALIGDPHRLRQIMFNLIGNAVKFTRQGEVIVEVALEQVGPSDASLRFAVKDTGIGIAPEHRAKLFQAFEQADTSVTREFGGTGLGLAITLQMVSLMGGRIDVESELGKGTTFTFFVQFGIGKPLADGPPEPPVGLSDLQVLAVDDNPTNRIILDEMLTSWGMNVIKATNAFEAMAEAKKRSQHGFSLVITDANMPGADGFELAQWLRQDAAHKNSKIIMLTSSGRADDAERCRELGVDAHLTKPVKQSALFDVIANVFGHKKGASRPRAGADDNIARQRPLHILLAEDNVTNQRLAAINLESWGHHVSIADNGELAVAAVENGKFDLVLMDMQMPKMSGLEATTAIRAREKSTGTHVPIIAMTANAMAGDRENCVAAGMDEYVTKPIRYHQLVAAMGHVIPDLFVEGKKNDPSAGPNKESKSEEKTELLTFDRAGFQESLGHDPALVREVIGLFMKHDSPRLVAALKDASQKNDLKGVEEAAHALKGALGELHAANAYELSRKLEFSAHAGDDRDLASRVAALVSELEKLDHQLQLFLGSPRLPTP
ncbi:MAG TPA: response regulator [Verrucomicrobiae bacterium]